MTDRAGKGAELFLRAVVVNFAATIDDTNDLATLRGSSIAALELPGALVGHLRRAVGDAGRVDVVYHGASELLARIVSAARAAAGAQAAAAIAAAPKAVPALVALKKGTPAAADVVAVLTAHGLGGAFAAELAGFDALAPKARGRALQAMADTLRKGDGAAVAGAVDDGAAVERLETLVREACAAFPATDDDEAERWCARDLTMVVAVRRPLAGEPFPHTLNALATATNVQQYQRLTLALPEEATGPAAGSDEAVCAVDRVRPALPKGRRRRPYPVSASVLRRQTLGRDAKHAFYLRELERLRDAETDTGERSARFDAMLARLKSPEAEPGGPWAFPRSFADLLDTPPSLDLPASLQGKMALLYLDGNNFHKRRRAFGRTADTLGTFSRHIAGWRGDLLCTLLDWALGCPDLFAPAATADPADEDDEGAPRRLRLETLLWGGDEMMWLLPAWRAWDAMAVVQAHLACWRGPEAGAQAKPLTHSAGLLIAPHKAPIRDLTGLARALGDTAKRKDAAGASSDRNLVQVLVMDAIDQPDPSVNGMRAATTGVATADAFTLDGTRWDEITEALAAIRARLGRRQFHRFARTGGTDGSPDELVRRLAELSGLSPRDPVFAPLGNDLLTADSAAHPEVPLHQVLALWDVVSPLAVAEGAR